MSRILVVGIAAVSLVGITLAGRDASADPPRVASTATARALAHSTTSSQSRLRRPAGGTGPLGWRSRTQLGAAQRSLRALRTGPRAPSLVQRQPLLNRLGAYLRGSARGGVARMELGRFLAQEQARLGPLSTVGEHEVPHYRAFLTEKALTLAAYRRTPAQVTEGFVDARGSVDGEAIADRRLFVQRWAPVQEGPGGQGDLVAHGAPSGTVVVISPGFQETGRNFYEQIDQLTRAGHEVVVMDHQWAGYSQGSPGGIDRGFGVARDVAAVAAFAAQPAHAGEPPRRVVLVGNSMGAGPGVLGAITLNDTGRIALRGPAMPRGLSAVLQSPFLAATPSLANRAVGVLARVPGVRDVPLFASGVPSLTHQANAQAAFADHATFEDVRARPSAMVAANADLRQIVGAARPGAVTGRFYMVQQDHDPLADPAATRALAQRLGGQAHLEMLAGHDHVLEENPAANGHVVAGVAWLAGAR